MKTLILVHSMSYASSRILDELTRLKVSCEVAKSEDLVLQFPHSSANWDLVFNRLSPVKVNEQDWSLLGQLASRQVNSLEVRQKTRSKSWQFSILASEKLPLVPTLMIQGAMTPAKRKVIDEFVSQEQTYIVKPNRGMQGIGVNRIQDLQALYSWLETFHYTQDQDWLIQPEIKVKAEYRLQLLQGKIWACLKKLPKEGKANFHQGAEAVEVDVSALPPKLVELSARVEKVFHADYLALDIAELPSGEFLVFECNSCPGIEFLEKVTQRNFAQALVQSVLKS